MAEESTTPDLVELMRDILETMDRDWDLDAVMRFYAPDAVWDLSTVGFETPAFAGCCVPLGLSPMRHDSTRFDASVAPERRLVPIQRPW